MQTGKYWVNDYLSLFLRGISFWYFLSNYLVWPFLIIVPDIFNQDIPDLYFIKKNKPIKSFPSCWTDKPCLFPQQIFSFFIFNTNCFISLSVSGLPFLFFVFWEKVQYPLINLLIHFSTVSGFTRVKWPLTLSVILLRTEEMNLFLSCYLF